MTTKTAVFGEALFDLIEQSDDQLSAHIGGSPFNVARSFAKQGLDTHYLSPLATDRYGERLFEYAVSEGIQLPADNRSFLPTSLALVYTDADGQPDYRLYRQSIADLDIDAQQLIDLIPEDLALFHTGSLALVPSMVDVLVPCFIELKKRNVLISLDINMRKGVERDNEKYIAAVLSLVPFADIVKVSDEDLLLLGIDTAPLEGAQQILTQLNNGIVLLTEGANGATLLTSTQSIARPVYTPTVFTDAVGAGDTFFSAFLAQLLRGQQEASDDNSWSEEALIKALHFGLMAATLNVEQQGCQPPSQEDVIAALKTR